MNLMGIDVGTTSVKAAVFNEKLEMIKSSCIDYLIEAHGDIVEFEAEKYWEIVKTELDSLDVSVDALAIDTQCETLILTDEMGNPVRKAIVWLDNRATKEAQQIAAAMSRRFMEQSIGSVLPVLLRDNSLDNLMRCASPPDKVTADCPKDI